MAVINDYFLGAPLPAALSGLPASALKYLPQPDVPVVGGGGTCQIGFQCFDSKHSIF